MNKRKQVVLILVAALVAGAIASRVVQHEAALLGFSAVEVALMGLAVGGAMNRAAEA